MKNYIYIAIIFLLPVIFFSAPSILIAQALGPEALAEIQALIEAEEYNVGADDTIETVTRDSILVDKDEEFGIVSTERPTNFESKAQKKVLGSELSKFGYSLFSKATTTFAPATDIPIPPDYVMGPGDNIKIILFGNYNDTFSLQITREGSIYFPSIGPITVAGLSFDEMKQVLLARISNQFIGAEIQITMGALRSITIFVLGDAFQPGSYTISALTTLSNALMVSGGVGDIGSLRNIQLKRKGETISTFDFYDLLLKGDTSKDLKLQQGDVIFIPPVNKMVGITGEVRRPALYELLENENLDSLINYAGGLKPSGDLSITQIERIQSATLSIIDVDLNNIDDRSRQLTDGDIIHVYPIINRLKNVVLLSNYIQRPGFYQWKSGQKFADLIRSTDDILPNTDRGYALIKREDLESGNMIFRQININKVLHNKDSNENILLMPRDEIVFFPSIEIEADDTIKMEVEKQRFEAATKDQTVFQAYLIVDPGTTTLKKGLLLSEGEYIEALRDFGDVFEVREDAFRVTQSVDFAIRDDEAAENAFKTRRLVMEPIIQTLINQASPNSPPLVVELIGGFRYPGSYPITPNMTIEEAINAGGGLIRSVVIDQVEIIDKKFDDQGQLVFTKKELNLNDPGAYSTTISPDSILAFKTSSIVQKQIQIEGQVRFPGRYVLTRDETIRDLIENRAGGLTDEAFLPGVVFTRQRLANLEQKTLLEAQAILEQELLLASLKTSDLSQVGREQTMDMGMLQSMTASKAGETRLLGRLVVDLDAIFKEDIVDIPLEDGDYLYVPTAPNSLATLGEVYVPSTHMFDLNLSIDDYINLSGGLNKFADESEIYVIGIDGSIKHSGSSGTGFFRGRGLIANDLQPGDTIVIPIRLDRTSPLKASMDVTQIIYQMAIAAAAVQSF